MKKLLYNKVLKSFMMFYIAFILVELLFKIIMGFGIFDYSTLRILLSSGIYALILSIIVSFLPTIMYRIVSSILIFGYAFYAFLQAGFYNYLGVFLSFGTASQAGAVTDYIMDFIKSLKFVYYLIFIPFIIYLIYIIFFDRKVETAKKNYNLNVIKNDNKKKEFKKNMITRLCLLVLTLIFGILFYGSLSAKFMQNKIQLISNKSLFKSPAIPNIALVQFGTGGYLYADIRSLAFPVSEADLDALETSEEEVREEVVITDLSRTFDDTAWKAINESEKNADYKKLNNYFMNQIPSSKNEYTGIFQDKNLIVIMMESVNNIFINQEFFPNFYKLYSEGWHWNNSYSPRNNCSTGNNEMSGMISLYSINNTCTVNTYKKNEYYEAIFNVFKSNDYETSSFHNYNNRFYARNIYQPNMGSNKYYNADDLGMSYVYNHVDWPSDVDLVDKAADIFMAGDNKYMTWLTTVSSHQIYTSSSILGDMYLSMFSETGYDTSTKRYLSKLKVLDNALGELLKRLEEDGTLDDTVIVLYGDHYPYNLTVNEIEKVLKTSTSNLEIDRTPFVIYNSTIEPKEFNEYTSYVNILPTVANLFNLNYDPRLYVGHDLLDSEYDNRVIFADGSWRDPKGFYNSSTGKITYNNEEKYTDEEIVAINKVVSNKIKMSNLAIKTNYFADLKKKLDAYYNEYPINEVVTEVTDPNSEEDTETEAE